MATSGIKLLAGINCFRCGYNMTGSLNWVCSECGAEIQRLDVIKYKLCKWYLKKEMRSIRWDLVSYVPVCLFTITLLSFLLLAILPISYILLILSCGYIPASHLSTHVMKSLVRKLWLKTSYLLIIQTAPIFFMWWVILVNIFSSTMDNQSSSQIYIALSYLTTVMISAYFCHIGYKIWIKLFSRLIGNTCWDSTELLESCKRCFAGITFLNIILLFIPTIFIAIGILLKYQA